MLRRYVTPNVHFSVLAGPERNIDATAEDWILIPEYLVQEVYKSDGPLNFGSSLVVPTISYLPSLSPL